MTRLLALTLMLTGPAFLATGCGDPEPTDDDPIGTGGPGDTGDTEVPGETGETGMPSETGVPSESGGESGDASGGTSESGETGEPTETGETGAPVAYTTIADIRGGTVVAGTQVWVQDLVVTAVTSGGFFAQESGVSSNGGIYVYLGSSGTYAFPAVSDEVTVQGVYDEYYDLAQLQVDHATLPGSVTNHGAGTAPTPVDVTLADLADTTTAESYESMLVKLAEATDLEVVDVNNFDEWTVSLETSSDEILVDDALYNAVSDLGIDVRATVTSVQGVLNYTFSAYKVAPVEAANVVGYTAAPVDTGPVVVPDLIISEYCDPDASGTTGARFIELYNAGSTDIDLADYNVVRESNGGGNYYTISMSGTLTAGSTWVIANDATTFDTTFNIDTSTNITPDQTHSGISGNGDDTWAIEDQSGNVIDILGEYGVDGTGEDWEYTDQCISRVSTVTSPNATWTDTEWSFDGAVSAGAGTPGTH